VRKQTKLFVKESIGDNGTVDSKRVQAVCDYIAQNAPQNRKISMLRAYMKALKPVLAREEALVEISGDITEADFKELENFVFEQTGRNNIRLTKVINKELLGGVKITCADKIWEYTTISAIGTLRPNTQKNI
jgi:F0F1-type ATP synthase delta subunit